MTTDIEKAFEIASFMGTLNNQKSVLAEEYNQSLHYFINGASFKVNPELLSFVSTLIKHNIESTVLIDQYGAPVMIDNLLDFFNSILATYTEANNSYYYNYQKLTNTKKIGSILDK